VCIAYFENHKPYRDNLECTCIMKITIGTLTFKTQTECEKYTRSILTDLGITDCVKIKNEEYFNFLFLLCKRHPRHHDKLNKFVDFKISQDALNKRGLALTIINNDDTNTEISWRICVTGKGKSSKTLFHSALRQCISYQIKDFKNASDLSFCRECRCSLHDKTIHIDHDVVQFIQLVENFMNKETIIIPIEYDKKDVTFQPLFKDNDKWIGDLFELYHLEHATLRVLCETCNLTRKKYITKNK
jgi:hypothetical protein